MLSKERRSLLILSFIHPKILSSIILKPDRSFDWPGLSNHRQKC